jgi:acrylyl-CoA reductase (NADPH)
MTFRALTMTREDSAVRPAVADLDEDDLPAGEVLVEVAFSGLNYKDAMVTEPGNRVARISPLVPGIDLAGTVRASTDPSVPVGSAVLAHGYDLGVSRHGGFAELARVPAEWVVPLPAGMSPRHAMAVGTAGFTALLSVVRLEQLGIGPGRGPVLVTGATEGVGSTAVAALAHRGYEVVASTGKDREHDYLRRLGAAEVIGRDGVEAEPGRVLGPERWAAAVDCVGGATLAQVLRTLRYGGAVAASGLTGGTGLETTVFPFITRHVSLLGIDSVLTPIAERRAVWAGAADAFAPDALDTIVADEVGLDGVPPALVAMLGGSARGRVLVRPGA